MKVKGSKRYPTVTKVQQELPRQVYGFEDEKLEGDASWKIEKERSTLLLSMHCSQSAHCRSVQMHRC